HPTQPHIIATKLPADSFADTGFFTETEMLQRERSNLARVLEKANWKIKGPDGAAELMGIKASTLLARIKKLGLQRENNRNPTS
ncbi:MAG: hypothetical protein WBN75_09415, partial [Verrucomicrobiia bacterium]